jgi:iron complex transport system ATP-binding protein
METLIDIRHATVYRDDAPALDRLSLAIRRGESTAILGPNGAGKSTLLKLLSRELYPLADDDSRVELFGRRTGSVWELRAHLGIVSNDLQRDYSVAAHGLHVVLSGFHASIGVWAHQSYDAAQIARAHELMDQLGILALAGRPFGALSTGEQRRCLLARALVHDPELLVLDEPTSGLDPAACFHYLDTLRALIRAGKTVILVTHHLHEIPPEIARVVLLRRGQVLADGPRGEIMTEAWLRALFDTDLRLIEHHGFYQVLPHD